MILLSQVINGVLLPFVLIFMILLINKHDLMGEWIEPAVVQRGVLDHGRGDHRADAGLRRDHRSRL